jgi:hypothetical protein
MQEETKMAKADFKRFCKTVEKITFVEHNH